MDHSARQQVIAQIQHLETVPMPYTPDFEGEVADRVDA